MLIFACSAVFVEKTFCADNSSTQSWDDIMNFDRDWRTNHEAVTDKEFEDVMKRYEKKKKPKKYEFEANEERDSLNDMSILNDIANYTPIVLFPVNLRSYEGETIPTGYYQLNYIEKENTPYIVLTQGRKVYARLKMQPTNENFKSESIQFAEIRENDEESLNLIYGNLDLNLVKKLYIIK